VGQVQLVLSALAPAVPCVPLVSDLVPFRPDLAAYLLPGLMRRMPTATLFLCVVDPGVGGARDVLAADLLDGRWLVGPDNGLLEPCLRRAERARVYRALWRPAELSDSFHGRDLFAPIAAAIVSGSLPESQAIDRARLVGSDWPDALAKICYVDRYGNLLTGLPADELTPGCRFTINGFDVGPARTFCEVPPGRPFWYRNAFGLAEIAVSQGRADRLLGLSPGDALPPAISPRAEAPGRPPTTRRSRSR
jgi:hypothetical protein